MNKGNLTALLLLLFGGGEQWRRYINGWMSLEEFTMAINHRQVVMRSPLRYPKVPPRRRLSRRDNTCERKSSNMRKLLRRRPRRS